MPPSARPRWRRDRTGADAARSHSACCDHLTRPNTYQKCSRVTSTQPRLSGPRPVDIDPPVVARHLIRRIMTADSKRSRTGSQMASVTSDPQLPAVQYVIAEGKAHPRPQVARFAPEFAGTDRELRLGLADGRG